MACQSVDPLSSRHSGGLVGDSFCYLTNSTRRVHRRGHGIYYTVAGSVKRINMPTLLFVTFNVRPMLSQFLLHMLLRRNRIECLLRSVCT